MLFRSGSSSVDVIKVEAVHLGTPGYSNISNPKMGLKVTQGSTVVGTFTFDVWGAPWYVENRNNVSSTMQRLVDAYDYKYGGLYVEICVIPDVDPVPEYSKNTSGITNSAQSTIILNNVTSLTVGMGVTGSSAIPTNTRITSIDTNNSSIVLSNNLTNNIADGVSLNFTSKIYSMQIRANGMNLTNNAVVDAKKIYLTNNFTNNGVKFFNEMNFYGYKIPTTASNSYDPLQTYYVSNGVTVTANYLYDTYIDNVYVIEGDNEQECLLGPTTKVFNILPKAGNRLNSDWQEIGRAHV